MLERLLPACVWMFASVYGEPQKTATGETFDGKSLTVAVRDVNIPLGAEYFLLYQSPKDHKLRSVPVRVNDRGPFPNQPRKRDLDLSVRTATDLEFRRTGKNQTFDLDWVCAIRIK